MICPQCGKNMIARDGRFGKFWGCSGYPKCRYTKPYEEEVTQETERDFGAEILALQQNAKKVELNEQQKAYVYAPTDANIRVMAGPGSGKTTSTIERIVHLINEGVDPNKIVYVTFAKAMADEGYTKILARLPQVANTRLQQQACTIHALCYRILKWEGYNFFKAKDWELKKYLNEAIDKYWQSPEKPGWGEVLYWIDNAKYNNLTPSQDYTFFSEYLGRDYGLWVHKIRVHFEKSLADNNLITFSDMLYKVEQLLETNLEFRKKWQGQFSHILCDEAQDTNAQALRILITLADSITLIGDVDQMLYRFNGASPEILAQEFPQMVEDEVLTFKLETNYRSTRTIVELQKQLIENNYGPRGYDTSLFKMLKSRDDAPQGDPVEFMEFDNPDLEAEYIARQIKKLFEEGYENGDIFILSRTRAQLAHVEGALTLADIPYLNLTGGSFWKLKHVRDVIAYLKFAYDTDNDEAFKQIYNIASRWMTYKDEYFPSRWFGKAFLEKTDGKYKNLYRVSSFWKYKDGLADLDRFLALLQDILKNKGLIAAMDFVIENCYKQYLSREEGITSGDESENGKLQDFDTIRDIIESNNLQSPKKFFEYVDKMGGQEAKDRDLSKYVVISTVHRVKGQERKVVFGIGISEGVQYIQDKEEPAGLLPHTFSLTAPPVFGILPTGSGGNVQDERCIMFVLVSRAKERVYLSSVRSYRKAILEPSRFIEELELLETKGDYYD